MPRNANSESSRLALPLSLPLELFLPLPVPELGNYVRIPCTFSPPIINLVHVWPIVLAQPSKYSINIGPPCGHPIPVCQPFSTAPFLLELVIPPPQKQSYEETG